MSNLVRTDPKATWRFITDNLSTHLSEPLVKYVAEQCAINEELGTKGKCGILKFVASRHEFLCNQQHRIHFYTPKHTSWLNQIEIWLGVLRRKLTRFGSFDLVEDLSERISRFIEYDNQTMPHPYH